MTGRATQLRDYKSVKFKARTVPEQNLTHPRHTNYKDNHESFPKRHIIVEIICFKDHFAKDGSAYNALIDTLKEKLHNPLVQTCDAI